MISQRIPQDDLAYRTALWYTKQLLSISVSMLIFDAPYTFSQSYIKYEFIKI